jgi:hypothetical protein
MTKILQIRRGTAEQHNNFVGLPGEITADTTPDAETVRVHNGETLGGIPLARADLSNVNADTLGQILAGLNGGGTGGQPGTGGGQTDLSAVPTEFWNTLFNTYGLRASKFFIGSPCPIANASYLEQVFQPFGGTAELDLSTATADCALVCQSPEAGYSIGDIVYAFGIGNRANPRPNLLCDSENLRVRLLVGGENFWVSDKTSGAQTPIMNSKWKAQLRCSVMIGG